MNYQSCVWTALAVAGASIHLGCSTAVGDGLEAADFLQTSSELRDPSVRLYVTPAKDAQVLQIEQLKWKAIESRTRAERLAYSKTASQLETLIQTPSAVWITGVESDVERAVAGTVKRASSQRAVPVFVAYNLPFRDCAQYSAGGATTVAEYQEWVDAFAAGLGNKSRAIVLLEPDGLGIIPFYNPFGDRDTWVPPGTLEWCQPAEADPATAARERFELLQYAVHALKTKTRAKVYLDGTHSGWLGAGDAADRLLQAGVQEADGFFLNVSNYEETKRLEKYGSWISRCIYLKTQISWWDTAWCASQYSPANPDDFSTWAATDAQYEVDGQNAGGYPENDTGLEHFVIDTSRNGTGPLDVTPYGAAPYNQPSAVLTALKNGSWCNPPGAGLGLRPLAPTSVPLVDAYLWIKVPGESDGSCSISGGARAWDYDAYNPWGRKTNTEEKRRRFDPLRGQVDPAAGVWFPEQALDLIANANPPLPPAP